MRGATSGAHNNLRRPPRAARKHTVQCSAPHVLQLRVASRCSGACALCGHSPRPAAHGTRCGSSSSGLQRGLRAGGSVPGISSAPHGVRYKCTIGFLQRMVVSALHASAPGSRARDLTQNSTHVVGRVDSSTCCRLLYLGMQAQIQKPAEGDCIQYESVKCSPSAHTARNPRAYAQTCSRSHTFVWKSPPASRE